MADQKLPSAPELVTNIVLLGHTGSGKSATGNTLLGQDVFTSKKQAGGVTMKCKMYKAATSDGFVINVIDTPGLFDLSMSACNPNKEIISCLTMAKEGIHVVLLVLSVNNRFSEEEESTLNTLQSIFESKILDYVIVVFTGGDELEADGQTLDEYLGQGCPDFLTRVLRLCGGRKVLLDNRTTNEDKKAKQLKQLLVHVSDVARQTGGKPYTDNMHRKRKLNMKNPEQPSGSETDKNIVSVNTKQTSVSKLGKNIVLVNRKQPSASTSEAGKNIVLVNTKQPSVSEAGKNIVLVNTKEASAAEAGGNIVLVNSRQPSASEADKNIVLMNSRQPSALEADKHIFLVNTEQPSASKVVKNIVLVGRTGNGKSATGNSLIGKQVFISETKATGVTMTCQTYKTVTPSGSRINVIDTPGLFDLSVSAEYLSKEIINCLKLAEGGLHVVVLVLSVRTRFTQEEENTLSTLQGLFGNEILDYLLVLFTGGDELEADNQTLDDYLLQRCPEFLKTILIMSGGRRVMFDNMTKDEGKKVEQVQQFLDLVAIIEEGTHGKPFRGQMQREIKEETERLRQQQKAIEASNLGETELIEMKKQLQMSFENKMSQMEQMVKTTLKESSVAHERMVSVLNENLEKAQRENINMRKEYASEQKKRMMISLALAVPEIVGATMGMCSIL